MTRPEIIRADSIDLQQDRDAPTAHHARPSPLSTTSGSLAPHQAETLREVAAETAEENLRSPRVSWGATANNSDDLQRYADDLADGIAQSFSNTSTMQAGPQQDALAVAQNGGQEADDAELEAENEADMDDDMMDKMSSSPSIEDEDIDFDFVYALRTFVASVEGQANATKGDTMVLLDDSNSYWWLVRVVKDSSIGYLPAEHIETPTERLARLNKHRNIDLSATMLCDQAEKSRNPLKSALKRKKAKTVQFAGNTYVDPSDVEYSSEEEELEAEYLAQQQRQQQQQQQQQQQAAAAEVEVEDETAKVEPLKPRATQNGKVESKKQDGSGDAASVKALSRTSEEIFDTRGGDGPKKTSDGTVRDSFFKDDTVETKKITLTPNLLRDDSATRSSSDSALKQRPSLDKLDKDVFAKDDKKKKDKKEKDKKPSVIRSFFSRKDKKQRGEEDDESIGGKRSVDVDNERDVEDDESQTSPERGTSLQRNPSKLQKQQPRTEPSPTRKPGGVGQKDNGMDLVAFLSESQVKTRTDDRTATMRIVDTGARDSPDGGARPSREPSPASKKPAPRLQPAIKSKHRMDLDEFSTDDEFDAEPSRQPASKPVQSNGYSAGPQAQVQVVPSAAEPTAVAQTIKMVPAAEPPQQRAERLSESPVQVSPVNTTHVPPLMGDTSSQEEDRSTVRSSPSPELIGHEDADLHGNKDSITTSSTTSTSTWNDVSLRAFFDSGSEIRDLLVVVYDKTDVEPVGPEHAAANNLFREPASKLAEITTQLDNMLGDWLARKQRSRGTV